jgi:adenosylcobinamide hydrolase
MLVWRFPEPVRAIASSPLGGGLGVRHWMINATVDREYARMDPHTHLGELASGLGLTGPGAGMLTAFDVEGAVTSQDSGVGVVATVGLGYPVKAAADEEEGPTTVGTINTVVWVPARLSDAALVNAVVTATEAKVQALGEYGVAATGTASDAVFIACPTDGPPEPYGGPRSTWGSRLARAVYAAVTEGTRRWTEDHGTFRP